MDIINGFLKGEWLNKAKDYINNPKKLKGLLEDVMKYLPKEGLKEVKDSVVLMYEYIRDIINGSYKDYDPVALAKIVAGLIYLVSPIDLVPDFLPLGLVDDAGVIAWVFNTTKSELERYKANRLN